MDFTKFMSMLDTGCLWFARIDLLGDPFEFTVPRGYRHARERWRNEFQKQVIRWRNEYPDTHMNEYIDEWTDRYTGYSRELPLERINFLKRFYYVNCWYKSLHESDAMWKIYLNSSEGVAVRTTCGILHEQLCQVKPFQGVRAVRYLDFNRKSMGDLWLGQLPLLKRSAFRHENEVRALLCYLDQKSEVLDPMHRGEAERLVDTISGVPVKVDLDRLVRGVVVSPTAPSWFLALVESVAKKFRLSAPVYQSSLASDPLT